MPIFRGEFPLGERAVVSSGPLRQVGAEEARKERIMEDAFDDSAVGEFRDLPAAAARELEELQSRVFAEVAEGGPPPVDVIGQLRQLRAGLEQYRRMPEVTFLRGHDFDQPLASGGLGSLRMRTERGAFTFEAAIPSAEFQPRYMTDAIRMFRAGLLAGISPGFRIPPRTVDPDALRLVQDPGEAPGVLTREIRNLVLYELSLVTRPAYRGTRMDYRREDGDLELRLEFAAPSWGLLTLQERPSAPVETMPLAPPLEGAVEALEALWL